MGYVSLLSLTARNDFFPLPTNRKGTIDISPGKITPLKARYLSELQNELLKVNGPLVIEFNHPDDSSSWHRGRVQNDRFHSAAWAVIESSPETEENEEGTCWVSLRDGCIMHRYMLESLDANSSHVGPVRKLAMGREGRSSLPYYCIFCCYLSHLRVSHLCTGSDCTAGAGVTMT